MPERLTRSAMDESSRIKALAPMLIVPDSSRSCQGMAWPCFTAILHLALCSETMIYGAFAGEVNSFLEKSYYDFSRRIVGKPRTACHVDHRLALGITQGLGNAFCRTFPPVKDMPGLPAKEGPRRYPNDIAAFEEPSACLVGFLDKGNSQRALVKRYQASSFAPHISSAFF